jgi:glycosyltransferase involved in cell wall biosynthesis
VTREIGAIALSAIVPAFNEGAVIERFLRALRDTLASITSAFEIIVIDDGSTDDTAAVVERASDSLPLTLLKLSRNFGKEAALTAGLAHARGDTVLIIDADFQDPLDLVPQMVARWREGYDMVYGVRSERDEESWLRRAGTRWFYRLMAVGTKVDVPPYAQDFRVLDRKVVDAINRLPERNRFMKGLYAWVGFKSIGIEYRHAPREGGASSFGWRRLARLALTGLTAFSNLPLRVWGAVGMVIALGAIGYGVVIAVRTLVFGNPVPGFTTLAVSIMFFAGVQLLSIGIIGEYVGRVYEETKGRPTFLVERIVDRSPLRVSADSRAPTEPHA